MISIIVPVYNEEEVLEAFINSFFKEINLKESYEIIFVNDGSTDHTENVIKSAMRKHKQIRMISYHPNRGLGHALRSAFKSAKGRIIVTMDSDLAHPPSLISKLKEKIDEGLDVAIGSRYVPSAGIKGVPYHKDLLSRLTNKLTGFVIRSDIKDVTSGFRAYNAMLLKKIGTKERGFEVELEILVKLIKKGARVAEIPFTSTDRQAGVSKFNVLSHGARYAKGLIRIIIYGGRNS